MTHAQLLAGTTASELAAWEAFEQVEGPLGQRRDDVLAAMTAYYVVSALGAKRIKLGKLLPRWDRQPATSTAMQAAARTFAARGVGTFRPGGE